MTDRASRALAGGAMPGAVRRVARAVGPALALATFPGPGAADGPPDFPEPSAIPAVAATVSVDGVGEFTIALDRDAVPNHVAAFLVLVHEGWYSGLEFHRVIPGYLVQTGDPATRAAPAEEGAAPLGPTERPAFRLPAEPSTRTHARGTVSMAWRDDEPGTAATEWFVTLADVPQLDGRATPIGRVVAGMDVVDAIAQVSAGRDRRPREPVRIAGIRLEPEPGGPDPSPGDGDQDANRTGETGSRDEERD